MKKLLITALSTALFCTAAFSQAKVREVVTSDYQRNGISVVAVERSAQYDSDVLQTVSRFNPGNKFDFNAIPTTSVRIPKDRTLSVSQAEANAAFNSVSFGKQILSSVFNRRADGTMDDKTVRYRGNYNAKDQDVINARASQIGLEALGDAGYALVNNSYIVFIDLWNITSKTDDQGKVTYYVNGNAFAYKTTFDEAWLNGFYTDCWIYDDDDATVRSAKIRAFENLDVPVSNVASASAKGNGNTLQGAMLDACQNLIINLENAIPAWNVALTVMATRPLRAKCGTKESISNGDRFRAYSYREDREGNLISVKRGFLRATTVSDNIGMATGDTEPTEFYQISGNANIQEGWTIKQSNDLKMGVSFGPRFGGFSHGKNGKSLGLGLAVDVDYLLSINTKGFASYALMSAGLDVSNAAYAPVFVGVGYGFGIHLTRMIELMPYAMILDDMLLSKSGTSSSGTNKTNLMSVSAFIVEPGVRISLNVAYPFQIYAKGFYDLMFYQGPVYKSCVSSGLKHGNGLGFAAGIKWTF